MGKGEQGGVFSFPKIFQYFSSQSKPIGSESNHWTKIQQRLAGPTTLVILIVANLAAFLPHYLGKFTFPWDFIGGYHTVSFGWYAYGELFSPPKWFPWAHGGFPADLSVQAGGWYLPLMALKLLGIPYSLRAATIVQSLHPILGGFGIYMLLRRLEIGASAALLGAVSFHFSAGFFSNQQHVDIIRAIALLPWLLWALHPESLLKGFRGPVIAAVLLFQFLVASYPGIIVAAAYACAAWCGFWGLFDRIGQERKRYSFILVATVVSGVLLSMIKWAPVFASRSAFDLLHGPFYPFHPQFFLTLLLPYDTQALPTSDPTMRCLYLPLAMLAGILFIDFREKRVRAGLLFVAVTIFIGILVRWLADTTGFNWLPGISASRFPVSDWRPIFQIGLIILGASGWYRLFGRGTNFRLPIVIIPWFCIIAATILMGLSLGYRTEELRHPLIIAAVSLAVVSFATRFGSINGQMVILCAVLLSVFAFVDGITYQKLQRTTWRTPWVDPKGALRLFGTASTGEHVPQVPALVRRPMRFAAGESAADAVTPVNYTNSLYNQCWYDARFGLFGYNTETFRLSGPHKQFYRKLVNSAGPPAEALFNFMRAPHQLALIPPEASFDPGLLPPADMQTLPFSRSLIDEAAAAPVSYAADQVVYTVYAPRGIKIVENEMWWPGWQMVLCSKDAGCLSPIESTSSPEGLRTWVVPAGEWLAQTRFIPPGRLAGSILSALGLVTSLITGLAAYRSTRRSSATRLEPQSGSRGNHQ